MTLPDLHALYPRLLHFGVAFGDLDVAAREATDWAGFARRLTGHARAYERQADEAWRVGRSVTAAAAWRHAADYFHFAQLRLAESPRKALLRARCRRAYRRLAPLLDPPAVAVQVPIGTAVMPGYLRVAAPGAPCVVLLGGLDSEKEVELSYFAELFLARGSSVCWVDGPGQGELMGRVPMGDDFEGAVARLLDWLEGHPAIGRVPLGCFGVSFGGHLACRIAATDPRVAACVSLGGFFDARILPKLPPLAAAAVRAAFSVPAGAPLATIAPRLTLEPLRRRLSGALLVVHGSEDHLVDLEQVEAMRSWGRDAATVWVLEGAEHVCTTRFAACLPAIGDWMTEALRARAAAMPVRQERG